MPEAPVTLQVLAGSILNQSCTLPTSSARISPSSFLRSLSSCCSNLPLLLKVLSSPSFIFCYRHLWCSPLPSNHLFTRVCGVLAHVADFPFFLPIFLLLSPDCQKQWQNSSHQLLFRLFHSQPAPLQNSAVPLKTNLWVKERGIFTCFVNVTSSGCYLLMEIAEITSLTKPLYKIPKSYNVSVKCPFIVQALAGSSHHYY